jgi:hypothetical protein
MVSYEVSIGFVIGKRHGDRTYQIARHPIAL